MTVDTVLVDGVDLASAGRIIKVWEGVHETAPLRGDLITIPGRDGLIDADRPFGALPFSLGLLIRGGAPDVTGFNDAWRALKAIVKPDRLVTLTRRLSFSTGNEDHTAPARLLGNIPPSQQTPADYRIVLTWLLLSGFWEGPATTLASTPRSATTAVTAVGDVRSRHMTITLSGSTGGLIELENHTNGTLLSYNAETSSHDVVIDVLNQRATQNGTDVSEHLNWTSTQAFQLEAGSNSIEFSGGSSGSTVAVSYRPAWL